MSENATGTYTITEEKKITFIQEDRLIFGRQLTVSQKH